MDWLPDFLKSFLPTPWSRRVATTSLAIALSLLFLPEWWPKIGLPPIDPGTLWLRLFLVSTILFLGSFVSLCLVARAYHSQNTNHEAEYAAKLLKNGNLDDLKERILALLSRHHKWVADPDVAETLKIERALATFHLSELDSAGMITTCPNGIAFNGSPGRQISQDGLAYLVSHERL